MLGEYSGFFSTLKEGLQFHGHDVTHVARKDGFKSYEIDYSVESLLFQKKLLHFLRMVILRITTFDIADLEIYYKFHKLKPFLKNFDAVQLINVFPFQTHPFLEKKCLKFIFKNNPNVFLSACGDDYGYVTFLMNSKLDYHILSPYLKNKKLKKHYKYVLKNLEKNRIKLYHFVIKNIKAIIPSDFDYMMAYRNHEKVLPLIPNPVNCDRLKYQEPHLAEKIIIFHGINDVNYIKKGNDIFEKALEVINRKYAPKIEIIRTKSLPYQQYIKSYKRTHILLDQIYAYDQGFNALEAMAQGKVVFTGAGKEWLEYYNLKENTVAINALPDAEKLIEQLEWLILHPEDIIKIAKNARAFVEREHFYLEVAKKYLNYWN